MNICIESHILNHPRRSGLLTYAEGLVNGLSRNDGENRYTLAYYSLKRQAQEMPGPTKENFAKAVLKVPDREFWGRQAVIDQFVLPPFLKKNKTNIFHRTSGYTMPAGNGVFKILTVHDLRTLTMNDQHSAQNIDQYKKAIAAVNACVVVSECTKRDLVEHLGVDEQKIKVVYLGADERYQRVPKEKVDSVKAKYEIREPYLFFSGSVPRKNLEGTIRGFAGCKSKKDFLLVVNCKYDVEIYQQLARELEIEDRILFIKNVSDEDMVALYNGCACFLFASLYEGFGLPILEAFHCGAPVITSNNSACPEVAGEAALLVDPHNSKEISEAIDQMCASEDLRASLVEKGYAQMENFSWDKFAQEMMRVYEEA